MAKESKEKKKTTEKKAAEKKATEKKGKKAYSEAQVERRKAVTDFLKSLIVPLIFCAIIGGFVMFVINFVNPTVETEPVQPYGFDGMEDPLVMETDELIFTMDTHEENYLSTQEGKNLPVEHCIKDTHGWQISEALADFAKQAKAVVEKPTFGSMELIK